MNLTKVFSLFIFAIFCIVRANANENFIQAIASTTDDQENVLICGYFQGEVSFGRSRLTSKNGSADMFVAKVDKNGNYTWAMSAGGAGFESAKAIVCENNRIFVAGNFDGITQFDFRKIKSRGASDIFFLELNPSGAIVSLKTAGGLGSDEILSMEKGENQQLIFLGTTTKSFSFFSKQINLKEAAQSSFVAVMNKQREIEWTYAFKAVSGNVFLSDLEISPKGKIAIGGVFDQTVNFIGAPITAKGNLDGFTCLFSESGDILSFNLVSTPYSDALSSMCFVNEKKVLVYGTTTLGMESKKIFLAEMDLELNKSSIKLFDTSIETSSKSVEAINEKVYLTGDFSEHISMDNVNVNAADIGSFIFNYDYLAQKVISGISVGSLAEGTIQSLLNSKQDLLIVTNRLRKEGKTEQAVFVTKVMSDFKVVWSIKIAEVEAFESLDPTARYVDFNGKLLVGVDVLKPLVYSSVNLLDNNGNIVEATVTDDYGDFTFHGLNTKNNYSVKAAAIGDKGGNQRVMIATREGKILGAMNTKGEFSFQYEILPTQLVEIAKMEEIDTELQLNDFISSNESKTEINIELFYETGEFEVPKVYYSELNNLAKKLRESKVKSIEIASYTDAIGEANSNLQLSQKRATAIANYLVKKGVNSASI